MRNRLTDRSLCAAIAFTLCLLPSVALSATTHKKTTPEHLTINVAGPIPNQKLVFTHIIVMVRRGDTWVKGAKVTVNLSMPGKSMPKTIVICDDGGLGTYDGHCVFTIAGTWLLKAAVQLPDGTISKQTATVLIK